MCKCLSLWNPLHCAGLCTLKLWQSNDSKQVTFSHRDLDSWVLIYHRAQFHLVVVLIHLWLLPISIIKTFARKLKCPLNCSLFHFNSSVDWFFFFSFKLRHIRASVSHSEGQAAWVLHSKLYADMHRGAFRVHKAAESWGSETAEGPWCSRDETGELLSPWLWHHDQNTKLSLFTYAASKHPRCYSMRSGDLD